ncbi:MAG: hypothetical protein ABIL58_03510 [Pseudomonadota bacterium]
MSKREKIIVACMVGAVFYGAFSFLFSGSGSKKTLPGASTPGQPLQQYVIEVIGQLKRADANATDTDLLDQAQGVLNRNPFYREAAVAEKSEAVAGKEKRATEAAVATIRFSYTGYVEMGKNRLAILDGREFAEGDLLNADGMYLKTITPNFVVIGIHGLPETTTIDIIETN